MKMFMWLSGQHTGPSISTEKSSIIPPNKQLRCLEAFHYLQFPFNGHCMHIPQVPECDSEAESVEGEEGRGCHEKEVVGIPEKEAGRVVWGICSVKGLNDDEAAALKKKSRAKNKEACRWNRVVMCSRINTLPGEEAQQCLMHRWQASH